MANQKQKSNNLPVAIIGLVLIGGIFAAWYFYSTANSGANANRTATNGNVNKPVGPPVNVPAGAIPPNLAGSPTASVTVEEFADFQCPTCASTHPIMNEIKSLYGTRIKFIFRHFPLAIPAHDKSYEAAVAAESAGLQGKFWDMQNLLFTNQQAWTKDPGYKEIWDGYAKKLGIDVAKFQSDMAGIGAKSRVDEDMKRGRGLNVNGTPTIFIDGVSVEQKDLNVSSLKMIIDGELQKAAAANQTPAKAPDGNAANTGNSNK
jgi:protein-disulfide isomerase